MNRKKHIVCFLIAAAFIIGVEIIDSTLVQAAADDSNEGNPVISDQTSSDLNEAEANSAVTEEKIPAAAESDGSDQNGEDQYDGEPAPAAPVYEYNVKDFGAVGDNDDQKPDSHRAFQQALDEAIGSNMPITVIIPKGYYYLYGKLRIWSNTTIKAESGAVMTFMSKDDGNMLYGVHYESDGSVCMGSGSQYKYCQIGKYDQIHDITIQGGTWNRNSAAGCNSCVLRLCHGENITLKDATFMKSTNHLVNLSGTRNVTITNCTFKDNVKYTGDVKEFWGSTNRNDSKAVKKRYAQLEAVHLDHVNANGEPNTYPSDGTPCKNIQITGCKFSNVGAGAGTHNVFIKDKTKYPNCGRASGLLISNCTFSNVKGYMADFCSFNNCTLKGKGTSVTVKNVSGICRIVDGSATVSGVKLYGMDGVVGPPVYVYQNAAATVKSININGNGNRGSANTLFYVGKKSTVSASSVTLANGNKGKPAITAEDKSSLTISKAKISSSKQAGIYARRAKKLTVKDSTINNSKDSGIYVTTCTTVDIQKNKVSGSAKNGIYAGNCTNSTKIKNNKIASSTLCGIYLDSTKNGEITGNSVSGSKSVGIYLSGSSKKKCTSAKVLKNTVKQNKSKPAIYLIGYCKNCQVKSNKVGGKGYYSKSKYKVKASGNKKL